MSELNNNYFENTTSKKSLGFKIVFALTALMLISIVSVRIYGLSTIEIAPDPTLYVEPLWYNYSVIIFGILALISLFFAYKYYKMGVFGTLISLFIIIIINPEFSLMRTLAPIFTLFIFTGYGLFEIIPRWKYFK